MRRLQHRRHRSWSFRETARPSLLECGFRRGDIKTFTSPPQSAHCPTPPVLPFPIFKKWTWLSTNRFFRLGFNMGSARRAGSKAGNLRRLLIAIPPYGRMGDGVPFLNSAKDVPSQRRVSQKEWTSDQREENRRRMRRVDSC